MYVTAVGMVSNLGLSHEASCAGIRAGLKKPADLKHYKIVDQAENLEIGLSGFPIAGVTDGFASPGRWLNMVKIAVEDLMLKYEIESENASFWNRTNIIFVLPDINTPRFVFAQHVDRLNIKETVCTAVCDELNIRAESANLHVVSNDARGFVEALELANGQLAGRSADRALIIACDSNIDSHSLWWLAQNGRVKTSDGDDGLVPGEAAVAILVEDESALEETREPLAYLSNWEMAEESQGGDSEIVRGSALFSSVVRTLEPFKESKKVFVGDVYSDLNGERWRSEEYGMALSKVPAEIWGDSLLHTPADIIGDTGAASGGISLGLCVHAKIRDYASHKTSLIMVSTEFGLTGSFLVHLM